MPMLSTKRAVLAIALLLAGCGVKPTGYYAGLGVAGNQSLALASKSAPHATDLKSDFANALTKYHRLDGMWDGSGLKGVQYPPVPGVTAGDEASLKRFIAKLADFLAKEPSITWKPVPAGTARKVFRKQVAQQAAADVKAHARSEFAAMVDALSDPNEKQFVSEAVSHAQPEFFTAPSSSSGTYHPADEINVGGLLTHSVRDMVVGGWLADYFHLSAQQKDVIQGSLLIHDIQKGGIPWGTYDDAHGPDGANWLEQFEPGNGQEAVESDLLVRDHMAQWNRPTPTPPETLDEQIVSYADYLGSLDDVYVDWHVAHP
ncbi:MAG TPA: HD domain-containing protein [Oscillatoriaceae cyanobacterium]